MCTNLCPQKFCTTSNLTSHHRSEPSGLEAEQAAAFWQLWSTFQRLATPLSCWLWCLFCATVVMALTPIQSHTSSDGEYQVGRVFQFLQLVSPTACVLSVEPSVLHNIPLQQVRSTEGGLISLLFSWLSSFGWKAFERMGAESVKVLGCGNFKIKVWLKDDALNSWMKVVLNHNQMFGFGAKLCFPYVLYFEPCEIGE